ncbi:hypothetical protein [Escherichia coli]
MKMELNSTAAPSYGSAGLAAVLPAAGHWGWGLVLGRRLHHYPPGVLYIPAQIGTRADEAHEDIAGHIE